ncbi:MAG: DUF4286 family protein [Filimonas sp.]|nr:DUF4286 family protein [Filimonas sp.]
MLIYNVTTKIDWQIHDLWREWMLNEHIPLVLGTGCFVKHQFVRILEIDETEGPTYAIQYYTESKAQYNRYNELYAAALRQSALDLWGDRIISFHSLMDIVN